MDIRIIQYGDYTAAINLSRGANCISLRNRKYDAGKMVLYDEEKDLSVVYENDEQMGFRLIYNGNADGYICLEPQTCLANCANAPFSREEAGFDYIEPGKEKKYVSRIYLVKGDKRGQLFEMEELTLTTAL